MPYKLPVKLNKEFSSKLIRDVDNFLFDCDGVIWNYSKTIPGSIELINRLKSIGKKCFFVTNNSTKTRANVIDQLKKRGVNQVNENDIVCTSWVLARYLQSKGFKDTCYVVGSPGIAQELDAANISHIGIGDTKSEVPDPGKCDYNHTIKINPCVKCVVVGFDYYFNYPKLVTATSYAHKNPECMFIATNDDAQFPSSGDSNITIPGTGTIVAAVETGVGRKPLILGKPHKTMWDVLESTHQLNKSRTCMIGDRLDTDMAFAANCSLGYSLAVLTGVTNESEIMRLAKKLNEENCNDEESKCVPDFYIESLGALENLLQELENKM